ncbi:GIY-YIG nuclease family protein [Desulfosporosinus meridiei]|uniref:GIY-YIG domain-containing protein n=1 Tax=Desulfosporosinus meridiei (strain ATCC BAA-275 / DSM 13257 / KCTC 12902 / NCIMB 13706 / S10) TaxID=768704 RepID=J7J5R2_DESMD|nr:GIY-YIG nuclease family protein [Desulfosporosinus meridiei]AFQ46276.1 hypothetical protein Desmer_4470 [Desulfosporosinus meridiei DSM 13257]
MFGTIILDAFTKSETMEIIEALDELVNPLDNYGWASAGIYSFWNYYTKELLYIGLAVDLTERFKQHNGIIPMDPNGCKKDKIEEYFGSCDKLGYTIFVQSSMSQPATHRNKQLWNGLDIKMFDVQDYRDDLVRDDIRRVEGILIESYRIKHGDLPPWNRVGGSILGQQSVNPGNYNEIVASFSSMDPNLLTARYSLREISNNPTFERYENTMHAIRMHMLLWGMSFGEARNLIKRSDSTGFFEKTIQEMNRAGYFKRLLAI